MTDKFAKSPPPKIERSTLGREPYRAPVPAFTLDPKSKPAMRRYSVAPPQDAAGKLFRPAIPSLVESWKKASGIANAERTPEWARKYGLLGFFKGDKALKQTEDKPAAKKPPPKKEEKGETKNED